MRAFSDLDWDMAEDIDFSPSQNFQKTITTFCGGCGCDSGTAGGSSSGCSGTAGATAGTSDCDSGSGTKQPPTDGGGSGVQDGSDGGACCTG